MERRKEERRKVAYPLMDHYQRVTERRKTVYEEGYDYYQNGSKVTAIVKAGFPPLISTRFYPIEKRKI